MPYADPVKQREYQRRWIAERRQVWLDANGPCANCGSSEDLHVDHIDPSKKVSHRVWSWSKERRDAELAQCQVLCQTCHQAKTNEQNGFLNYIHGTLTSYRWAGCRCRACKDAHAEHQRAWLAQKNT